MRSLFIALLFCLTAPFYTVTADAYSIHNMTGISAKFKGEDCGPCFKDWIADGDTKSCPGDKRGCRNTTTVSIVDVRDGFTLAYFGAQQGVCPIDAPVEVTAHGDVYAYKDHVVVKDDDGKELYNGPWHKPTCGNGGAA
jgi:hypothetical protein